MSRENELPDYVVSIKRTVVPVIVGSLLAWLADLGLEIDEATLTTLVTASFITVYYIVMRALEHRFPSAGVLLGSRTAPHYERARRPLEQTTFHRPDEREPDDEDQ